MEFSYYDTNNQIKKLDIKIGSKWSENKTGNAYLNSIFKSADNGDNIVQENEFSIVKFLLKKADSLISKTAGDGVVDDDELLEMTKNFKKEYKMSDLKNGRIDTIDPDDYTLESLKKRYPKDKFTISVNYEDISIIEIDTGKEILRANEDFIAIQDNQKIRRVYSPDGIMESYNGLDGMEHIPLAEDLKKILSERDGFADKKLIDLIQKVNSKNILTFYFGFDDVEDIDKLINSVSVLKDKPEIRNRILNHLNKCWEEYFDYKHDFINKNSQVKNKFYKGDSYSLDCKDEVITIINNRTRKKKTLDLKELVKNISLLSQVSIKKYISDLPGEVLMDLAIETDNFNNSSTKINSLIHKLMNASGSYDALTDKISLSGEGDLVHELGHAIDYHGLKTYSSIKEFKDAFHHGCKAFKKAGYHTCNSTYSENKNEYVRPNDINSYISSNYATANCKEMFAECYTYLMTGKCQSAAMLEDFFPECLEIVGIMLKAIRVLPDEVRHKK